MNPRTDRNCFARVLTASAGGGGLAPLTRFARQFAQPHAKFRLVDIVCNPATLYPTLLLSFPDWSDAHRAMLRGAQATLRETVTALGDVVGAPESEVIDLTALHQDAAHAVAHDAERWSADLIAVAGHPCEHRWAGRIDPEELVASTQRPVLYVPAAALGAEHPPVRRVLVGIDGSDTALDALRTALVVAPQAARFKVVYAADDPFAWREWLPFDVLARHRLRVLHRGEDMLKHSERSAETALLDFDDDSGDASGALLAEAQRWQADLIVMGSHGLRDAAHALPGHVTSRALHDARCPVLVCPRAAAAAAAKAGHFPHAAQAQPQPQPESGTETMPFYRP